MLARAERALVLLRAIEKGDVSAASIDEMRRYLLLEHRNEAIRTLADHLFGKQAPNPRGAVLADYRAALHLKGDPVSGEKVFEKSCMACHQLGSRGHAIGPSLASSTFRDPESLLIHILDPNQYVRPDYVQYVVADRKGRTYAGMIAAETATGITLKREQNQTDTILRKDIEEIRSTGKSLMPEGLEKELDKQQMANLLAFLAEAVVKYGKPFPERDFGTLPGLVEPTRKE
jgi:putative heme-binding domain-containing protein